MIIRLTVTLNNGDKHISEFEAEETDSMEIADKAGDFVVLVEINPEDA